MKQRTSQVLFSYWNEVRGDRVAPRRFEIEPSRIAGILPETFILECGEPGAYRFRLAGTRICELFGRELRGTSLLDLFEDDDRTTLERLLACSLEQAPVVVLGFDAVTGSGSSARFEAVLLPLLHTQQTVTRLLGSMCPVEHPAWLGNDAPERQVLVDHELVWPDGRPHSILQKMNRQSPFAAEPRAARIVGSDRRRFRVYEGGRTKLEGGDS
jgi:hypothetical protein